MADCASLGGLCRWRSGRVLPGAYLFGGITIIQLHIQGFGISIPSQILSMLPYLATVVVLTVISACSQARWGGVGVRADLQGYPLEPV